MTRTWVEISLSRLRQNVAAIRKRLSPSTEIIAVVKANAYGHGVEKISRCLFECGIRNFAVATLEEAVELRNCIDHGEVLVFGGCLPGENDSFREYDLTAALFDLRNVPADLKVEVKIDTGMNRLGIPWETASETVGDSKARITGVFSHFACSAEDPEFTRLQLRRFEQATQGLPYRRHISNSAALQFPEAHLEAVRPGLVLYGISPCPAIDYIQPILRWKTRILTIKEVSKGERIGYCGTLTTQRSSRIAVLPVGYADGYNRLLSSGGQVRIRDRLVSVLGLVSMDMISVDLTDIPNPQVGEEVVLLDDSADSPISALSLAETLGTIPYELLTWIGPRVRRVYRDS